MKIFKNRNFIVIFGVSLGLLILTAGVAFIRFGEITTPLIIHFDVYQGIDFFGGKMEIFGILFSAFVMILINFFLADFLYHRQRFLSYIFSFGSLWITILILISMGVIISIN